MNALVSSPRRAGRRARGSALAACVLLSTLSSTLPTGCATTFSAAELAPLRRSAPVDDQVIARATAHAPNDATWLSLEQAFSLLRHADSDDDVARARSFLETAFASFEDLRDPENLNVAFTADADTPYRGRPHERVLAATTLALTDAANGRCDLALPTLRAAEFLDVRWQRLTFGTDAAVVYTLARWCEEQTGGRSEDKRRAEEGVMLTLRYTAAAEAARALLHEAEWALPRSDAVAVKLAGELAELGVLSVLASDPHVRTPDEILSAGLRATTVFGDRIDELLAMPEFSNALAAALVSSGNGIGKDLAAAQGFVRAHLKPAIDDLARALQPRAASWAGLDAFRAAIADADEATRAVLAQTTRPRMTLVFSGSGPQVVREGQYSEIARLVPREGVEAVPALRRGPGTAAPGCGIRGIHGNGFTAVLCAAGGKAAAASAPVPAAGAHVTAVGASGDGDAEPWHGLDVWSSSVQATTVVGRRFDAILKGRAAFKAGTETASRAASWTAWTLLRVGLEMLGQCGTAEPTEQPQRRDAKSVRRPPSKAPKANEACVAIAATTLAAGVVVGAAGGVVWLAGATVNPAADPRFVNALPERVAVLLPGAPPVSDAPVSDAPASDGPSSDAPSSDAPSSDAPASARPAGSPSSGRSSSGDATATTGGRR